MAWRVESWSRELARGVVRSADGESLAFDASVVTLGDLVIGEAVAVERLGARVISVRPVELVSRAHFLVPQVRIEATGLLALCLEGPELERVEDLVFDELGLASIRDYRTGYVQDESPALVALLERELGRDVDTLVSVDGEYPFDWEGRGHLDPLLDRLAPTLPGFSQARPATFYFRDETREGAGLWWSIEPVGLQIGGVLARACFAEWRVAFERATASWPMRQV